MTRRGFFGVLAGLPALASARQQIAMVPIWWKRGYCIPVDVTWATFREIAALRPVLTFNLPDLRGKARVLG